MSAERPLRLHHHAFVVKDQEATRRFYEEVVGLPLVATWCEEEATLSPYLLRRGLPAETKRRKTSARP